MTRKRASQGIPATKKDVETIITRAIDAFAIVVGQGFADTQSQINGLTTELREFKTKMYDFKDNTERALYTLQSDVTDLKIKMGKVEIRLDKVEDHCDTMIGMWRDHETRIVALESGS